MVTELDDDLCRRSSECISRAFMDDPFFQAALAQQSQFVAQCIIFSTLARQVRARGLVDFAREGRGAAMWMPPGRWNLGVVDMIRAGMWRLPPILGLRGAARLIRMDDWQAQLHTRLMGNQPHAYLFVLAVDPPLQRQGFGTELVQKGLHRIDRQGVPCYLETHKPENVGFYNRFGFEVICEEHEFDVPTYAMVRRPRAYRSEHEAVGSIQEP